MQRPRPTAAGGRQLLAPYRSVSFSSRFTSTDTLSSYLPANSHTPPSGRSTPTRHSRTDLALVAHEIARRHRRPENAHSDDPHRRTRSPNGFRRCCRSSPLRSILTRSRESGGDMAQRLQLATRTTVGCVLHFSLLVFTQPNVIYLGAVWIGNIFYHVCLATNLGHSIAVSRGFARSVLLTSAASAPLAYAVRLIARSQPDTAKTILPFLSFLLSFLVMSCPWLTYRNLMILVMYIVIAGPVRNNLAWHVPLGYCASYLVGIAIAVLINVASVPTPNRACHRMHHLLQRYQTDFAQCVIEMQAYTASAGQSSPVARAAIAGIDLLVERMDATARQVHSLLPEVNEELHWNSFSCIETTCTKQRRKRIAVTQERLNRWNCQLQKQTSNFQMLQSALKQRFLGEPVASHDRYARHVRRIIASHMGETYPVMLECLARVVLTLCRMSDPIRACNNDEHDSDGISGVNTLDEDVADLRSLLEQNQRHFSDAVREATLVVVKRDRSYKSQLSHLARRMTSFHSIFASVKDLLEYTDTLQNKTQLTENISLVSGSISNRQDTEQNTGPTTTEQYDSERTRRCQKIHHIFCHIIAWHKRFTVLLRTEWLWHDPLNRRLAFKTSIGMLLASLFVSLDALWNWSAPFGFWPGLTIASVNLANQGSSFHKAADRLFGTLLAAAYALLVSDLFPSRNDIVSIASIGVFTFGVVYLRNEEHAYKYTYAATSIGSMSYGSVQNDVHVYGYVPKRIQLIFVGVILFAVIELLLFPRSSQVILERAILSFFDDLEEYLDAARLLLVRLNEYVVDRQNDIERPLTMDAEDSSECSAEISCVAELPSMKDLAAKVEKLKASSAMLTKEVSPAMKEPYFGFEQRLRPAPILGFTKESVAIYKQSKSLLSSLERLCAYYMNCDTRDDDVAAAGSSDSKIYGDADTGTATRASRADMLDIRGYNWPAVYLELIEKASTQVQICCDNLRIAYPDRRLRPQQQNSLEAVASAASFRDLDSVRLELVSIWSKHFLEMEESMLFRKPDGIPVASSSEEAQLTPKQVMTLGITVSFLLELCRHVQKAGKSLEDYARTFPPQSVEFPMTGP